MAKDKKKERETVRGKGYKPPQIGDICYVRSGYKEWSAGTRVVIVSDPFYSEDITVKHLPTKVEFVIPIELLVKVRKRGEQH